LRKGFGFSGTRKVQEQNRFLAFCFGLPEVVKSETRAGSANPATYTRVCDTPEAIRLALKDWLTGLGYLPATEAEGAK